MANNPGPFTFKGTVSYIVGRGKVAIVDPGPDDPAHIGGAARCRARRDRHAYFRHPHPPRPFAGGAGDQGGDRRHGLCRGPAPRRACRCTSASITRSTPAPTATSRPIVALKDGEIVAGDGWTDRGRDHARPYRQPHGLRAQGEERAVCRRPRHGLGDLDRRAARWRHERLHGLAQKLARRKETRLLPRPRTGDHQCAAFRQCLHSAPQGARSFDPEPSAKGRDRHSRPLCARSTSASIPV